MRMLLCKFLPPTNCKPKRIKVKSANKSKIYSWIDNLNPEENFKAAAMQFIKEMNWCGVWLGSGSVPDPNWSYAFIAFTIRELNTDFPNMCVIVKEK